MIIMVEIIFKRKKANHTVNVQGKLIQFREGVAEVSEDEATLLLEQDDYTLPPRKKKAPAKSKGQKK